MLQFTIQSFLMIACTPATKDNNVPKHEKLLFRSIYNKNRWTDKVDCTLKIIVADTLQM